MRRREFIAFLGTSALSWTLPANAQSGRKIARIGVLWHAGSAEEEREYLTVLVKAFGDLGYIEGKNVEFLNKFPAEQLDRLAAVAIGSAVFEEPRTLWRNFLLLPDFDRGGALPGGDYPD